MEQRLSLFIIKTIEYLFLQYNLLLQINLLAQS